MGFQPIEHGLILRKPSSHAVVNYVHLLSNDAPQNIGVRGRSYRSILIQIINPWETSCLRLSALLIRQFSSQFDDWYHAIGASSSSSTPMSDAAGPPPPAPAAREPGYTSRQTQILVVLICCMVLPTVVIGLRLLIRQLVNIRLWWDDYCAFLALVRPTKKGSREASLVAKATDVSLRFSATGQILPCSSVSFPRNRNRGPGLMNGK